MTRRQLSFKCKECGGQLVFDEENSEMACSHCGLVHDSFLGAEPMETPKDSTIVFFEEKKAEFEEQRKKAVRKRGRPRTRHYIKLRSFLMEKFKPFIKPKLSTVETALAAVVVATFKRAMYKRDFETRFPQFLKCPSCGTFNNGVNAKFTIDLHHDPPRLRIPLNCCGYQLDLKIRCSRCNWVVETKNGFFKCPNGCFVFPLEEVEKKIPYKPMKKTNLGNIQYN